MNLKIFKGYERFADCYPTEAVEYVLANKEEATPELLEILEHTLSDVENLSKDPKYLVHFPAIYLLAYFRYNARCAKPSFQGTKWDKIF